MSNLVISSSSSEGSCNSLEAQYGSPARGSGSGVWENRLVEVSEGENREKESSGEKGVIKGGSLVKRGVKVVKEQEGANKTGNPWENAKKLLEVGIKACGNPVLTSDSAQVHQAFYKVLNQLGEKALGLVDGGKWGIRLGNEAQKIGVRFSSFGPRYSECCDGPAHCLTWVAYFVEQMKILVDGAKEHYGVATLELPLNAKMFFGAIQVLSKEVEAFHQRMVKAKGEECDRIEYAYKRQTTQLASSYAVKFWKKPLARVLEAREREYMEVLKKHKFDQDPGLIKTVLKGELDKEPFWLKGMAINGYVIEKMILQAEVWEQMQEWEAFKGIKYADVWKLLIDGSEIPNGCYIYEDTPGFMMGMLSGFKYVLGAMKQKMDLKWFEGLRKACAQKMHYELWQVDGFKKLKEDLSVGKRIRGYRVLQNLGRYYKDAVEVYRSVGMPISERGMKAGAYWAEIDSKTRVLSYYPKEEKEVRTQCAAVFDAYYKEIKAAKNDAEKEQACIRLAQRIDACHFYGDGNLRMAILVLYRTFLENGLQLPLLDRWIDLTFEKTDVLESGLILGRQAFEKLKKG